MPFWTLTIGEMSYFIEVDNYIILQVGEAPRVVQQFFKGRPPRPPQLFKPVVRYNLHQLYRYYKYRARGQTLGNAPRCSGGQSLRQIQVHRSAQEENFLQLVPVWYLNVKFGLLKKFLES